MQHQIVIPEHLYHEMKGHLFQSDLEQGAFLLAQVTSDTPNLTLTCSDLILIPPSGWDIQSTDYLQMSDEERARIMKIARNNGACLIECHSHPGAGQQVEFSFSDRHGLTDFVQYAKWKLDNRPYGALVWGEHSFDGRIWYADFKTDYSINQIIIRGSSDLILKPAVRRRQSRNVRPTRY